MAKGRSFPSLEKRKGRRRGPSEETAGGRGGIGGGRGPILFICAVREIHNPEERKIWIDETSGEKKKNGRTTHYLLSKN